MILVGDLGHRGGVFALDPATGEIAAAADDLVHGFGLPYPEPFTGAYADGGVVWLRVGRRLWDATTVARCVQLTGAAYRLEFVDGSHHDIAITFPPRPFDPAYDEIESWSDDPMKLLPYVAADGWSAGDTDVSAWARKVLPLWTHGVSP